MASLGELIRPKETDRERALGLLVRTYSEDPMYRYIWPKKDERVAGLRRFLAANLAYAMKAGGAYATPQINGVICWVPPTNAISGVLYLLRTGFGVSRTIMGFQAEAQARLVEVMQYNERVRKQTAPGKRWYLGLLGVDRPGQFQATATRLMQPQLDRLDAGRQICYLEASNRSQVSFFQTLGFEVVNEGQAPKSNLTLWAMLRRPRAKQAE